jgi:hypothetical protein
MKILVIGGMHGNEPLGLNVVKLFQNKPVRGVNTVLANEQAILKNRRFIKTDLNRSFPGNIKSANYETKRAAELLKLCKAYDVVLDFHNTYSPNNDCTFVGKTAKEITYKAASFLNLKRIIVADYDCINKYAPNCLSVEISLTGKRKDPGVWYKQIAKLSQKTALEPAKKLEKYQFVYRITLKDRGRLNLKKKNLRAFKPISKKLANALGVKNPAYPIFVGDGFTPYNFGGLLNKLN